MLSLFYISTMMEITRVVKWQETLPRIAVIARDRVIGTQTDRVLEPAERGLFVQHFSQFCGEDLDGKWLVQEDGAGLEHAMRRQHTVRISGHVNNFHPGAIYMQLFCQFRPFHLRHDHICQQKMNLSPVSL